MQLKMCLEGNLYTYMKNKGKSQVNNVIFHVGTLEEGECWVQRSRWGEMVGIRVEISGAENVKTMEQINETQIYVFWKDQYNLENFSFQISIFFSDFFDCFCPQRDLSISFRHSNLLENHFYSFLLSIESHL